MEITGAGKEGQEPSEYDGTTRLGQGALKDLSLYFLSQTDPWLKPLGLGLEELGRVGERIKRTPVDSQQIATASEGLPEWLLKRILENTLSTAYYRLISTAFQLNAEKVEKVFAVPNAFRVDIPHEALVLRYQDRVISWREQSSIFPSLFTRMVRREVSKGNFDYVVSLIGENNLFEFHKDFRKRRAINVNKAL